MRACKRKVATDLQVPSGITQCERKPCLPRPTIKTRRETQGAEHGLHRVWPWNIKRNRMVQGRYGQNIPRLSKSPYYHNHLSTATPVPVHVVCRQHVLLAVGNAFAFICTIMKTSRQNDNRTRMKQSRRPQQTAIAH